MSVVLKYSNEEFIKKCILIHGDKYDYQKTLYTGVLNKIIVICKIHGEFNPTANGHLNNKNGCPKCYRNFKKNLQELIAKANEIHNNFYNYEKFIYLGMNEKSIIICPIHGEFEATLNNHIRLKSKCLKCVSDASKITLQNFIIRCNEIHNNYYIYSKVELKGAGYKVLITCPKHGDFSQKASSHLEGHGCSKCQKLISKPEIKWLDSLNIPLEWRNKNIKIDGNIYKPDAIDVENKIIWEFYGNYWHGNPNMFDNNDIHPVMKKSYGELYAKTIQRKNKLEQAGYQIVYIWEKDWNDKIL